MLSKILNYIKKVDLYLLGISLICSVFGLFLIYSATSSYSTNKFVLVQAFAIGLGVVAFIISSLIDVDHFGGAWKWLFVLNLLFQCTLFIFGTGIDTTGSNGWIRFAGIGIQPSEIGKIIFVFTFSMHVNILKEHLNHWSSLIALGIHAGVTIVAVVATSSDMGMAIAYAIIAFVILFIGGISWKWILGALSSVVLAVPVLWNFILKEYHKLRILVIFDPSLDPDKAYQGLQSQTAIGAGGLTGSGYMEGTLTQFGGLPAKHTDFIFSVAAEELGFIGAMAIIILLSILILRLFYVCFVAPSLFSSLICAGIAGMFLFQVIQNILMCLAITPVIGLTLPFFSYGGTSILTMFVAIGIVAGIRMREKPDHLKK